MEFLDMEKFTSILCLFCLYDREVNTRFLNLVRDKGLAPVRKNGTCREKRQSGRNGVPPDHARFVGKTCTCIMYVSFFRYVVKAENVVFRQRLHLQGSG